MKSWLASVLLGCGLAIAAAPAIAQHGAPIIDMHLHAHLLADFGGGGAVCMNNQKIVFPGWDPRQPISLPLVMRCLQPVKSAATDEAVMRESIARLKRHNIWAITNGATAQVEAWRAVGGDRVIPALAFSDCQTPTEEFRRLHAEGKLAVFAEITAQYRGKRLDDACYEPYYALAEALDIPVGVHLGEGPPGGAHLLGDTAPSPYRAHLTSPLQLERVLIRHPKLRIYVMHFGSPLVDEMIALMFSHPQVYVDVAQNNWGFPREHFYSQLKRLIDAGFEERIMWGSDQMVWPQAIDVAIQTIEQAPFLSAQQKRNIFYHNAARFLRLDKATIDRHHQAAAPSPSRPTPTPTPTPKKP